jgi:uncharacterized phage-associated protein
MLDPRAIANFILDMGDQKGIALSNLSLNKIAYFLHGSYLAQFNEPLIDAKIEAWQYGPVIREIYQQFKQFADKPISGRAKSLNIETGEMEECKYLIDNDKKNKLATMLEAYLNLKPFKLVELSHVDGGPWDQAWHHDDRVNPGMEITNDSIKQYFQAQVRH